MNSETRSSQEASSLNLFLEQAISRGCSDIHLQINLPPHCRISGKLQPADYPVLSENQFWQWAEELLMPEDFRHFQTGSTLYQVVQYAAATLSVHAYRTVAAPAMSIRLLISAVPPMDKLGLPILLKDILQSAHGLILVSGLTGSGKTTSLVSLANHINETSCCHIVSLEDPLCFIYPPKQSLVTQLIKGIHIDSFVEGFDQAQQIDADVIVLNEICDRPTLDKALQAAQSGYLVLACMHSARAMDALETLFSFYSEAEQPYIQNRLSKVLKAILAQRLIPTISGQFKRAALHDLLIVTPQVKNRLAEGHLDYLTSVMEEDSDIWPRTMRQDLNQLLGKGRISQETFAEVSPLLTLEEK